MESASAASTNGDGSGDGPPDETEGATVFGVVSPHKTTRSRKKTEGYFATRPDRTDFSAATPPIKRAVDRGSRVAGFLRKMLPSPLVLTERRLIQNGQIYLYIITHLERKVNAHVIPPYRDIALPTGSYAHEQCRPGTHAQPVAAVAANKVCNFNSDRL
jgi:hypothetical protein